MYGHFKWKEYCKKSYRFSKCSSQSKCVQYIFPLIQKKPSFMSSGNGWFLYVLYLLSILYFSGNTIQIVVGKWLYKSWRADAKQTSVTISLCSSLWFFGFEILTLTIFDVWVVFPLLSDQFWGLMVVQILNHLQRKNMCLSEPWSMSV